MGPERYLVGHHLGPIAKANQEILAQMDKQSSLNDDLQLGVSGSHAAMARTRGSRQAVSYDAIHHVWEIRGLDSRP